MFSQACVKNSVHRGRGVYGEGVHGRGGMHGSGECVMGGGLHGTRDNHCSGQYGSYWNAFLLTLQSMIFIQRDLLVVAGCSV